MAVQIWTNQASALLSVAITAVDTQITVSSGGNLFPAPGTGQYMTLTLESPSGQIEYVRCTSRTGNVFNAVVRAQEGSLALGFPAGTRLELRPTAGMFGGFFQKAGAQLEADLDANNFNIVNAGNITADSADITLVRGILRGTDNNPATQIQIPAGGAGATAGGSTILTVANVTSLLPDTAKFPLGGVIMWSGASTAIPFGWALCDGNNGTPDLRDRFVFGAGGLSAVGAIGAVLPTGSGGGGVAGVTGDHVLTVAEIPSHGHPMARYNQAASTAQSSVGGGTVTNNTVTVIDPAYNGGPDNVAGHTIGGTGGGGPHNHTFPAGVAHTHPQALPPYYALCFIMKVV